MVISVSQSKAKSWRQCRQQYSYKYVEGLKRRRIKRPFQFGRIVHEMIEAFANAEDPFEVLDKISVEKANMFAAEKEAYGEIIDDIRFIMTDYFDHWPEDSLSYVRQKGKSAEHDFEIEIAPGITFKGKIDAMARANKLRWLVEHKTFTRMPTDDHRWRNLQSSVYVRAIDMLGWKPVDGTIWDYIKSKAPPRPEILQSGALSQRKIETLPSVVKHTIKKHGLKLKDYSEFMELMKQNRSSYFARVFTPTSKAVVDVVFSDFVTTAKEIADLHGKASTRNIGMHCDFCDYEPICRAALQGSDVDFVKEREFTKYENEVEDNTEQSSE